MAMRVFFTGATGVLGRAAVPRLVAEGHDVVGVSRNDQSSAWLRSLGAEPVRVGLFDPSAVDEALAGIDAVVHFATAIPPLRAMADRASWSMNDRLRSEATGNLVDAAIARDVGRFVQESVTFTYVDGGDRWLDETAPVARSWDVLDSALVAENHVSRFTGSDRDGVVLRLARLYGPGPGSTDYLDGLMRRSIPVVGNGDNYVSSIHVDDAATAIVAAMGIPAGAYNVADDQPIRSGELTDAIAEIVGATTPRRVPVSDANRMLTTSHRISHRKLTNASGWTPAFPSAIGGWRQIAGTAPAPT